MPYCIVIWRRGTQYVDIAGLKPEDLKYLEEIPCLSNRADGCDQEGFIRFGPGTGTVNRFSGGLSSGNLPIKIAVVLTGLEVLGFKVVTTTASPSISSPTKSTSTGIPSQSIEYCWTLRREFSEPEPSD